MTSIDDAAAPAEMDGYAQLQFVADGIVEAPIGATLGMDGAL